MNRNQLYRLTLVLICILLIEQGCRPEYSNPNQAFQESDLVGIWEVKYGERGADSLTIKADGTFKQIYKDYIDNDYIYETPWNSWWLERFPDGRVRIHLMGARYYLEGIYRAERDGMGDPCPDELPDCVWDKSPFYFYDPIARETVYMIGELVLNIRSDSSGEIIMQHMWTSSDRGFPLIGAQSEIFKKIEPADSSIDG